VTISYDAATGNYTVKDGSTSATFSASDRTTSGYLDNYAQETGSVTDELVLFNNVRSGASQSSAPVKLTYLSYGIWTHTDAQTGDRRKTYLLFGYPTSDMPKTGSATYQTSLTATVRDNNYGNPGAKESDVSGSATFSADFGAGTVSTELSLNRVSDQSSLGTFLGTGTIGANQFNGTFSSTVPWFVNGYFNGGFFGPSASEMGYVFTIRKFNGDPYAGTTPQLMDQTIVGTVVGAKPAN
jgi:hypothetical protein